MKLEALFSSLVLFLVFTTAPQAADESNLPFELEYGMDKAQAFEAMDGYNSYRHESSVKDSFEPDRHQIYSYSFPRNTTIFLTFYKGGLVSFTSQLGFIPNQAELEDYFGRLEGQMDEKMSLGLEKVSESNLCALYRDDLSYVWATGMMAMGYGFSSLSFYEREYSEKSPMPHC
ncbi:hypothetical protein DFO67_1047 [Modicisalibacter xianhensis]|uniref:Uncharacterized protein n=1 Tax=Modicisalibacter xianhensis TaxID=442341 RepID=A0A4R8FVA6_9GAMM|nr:hypothetical protein [Halomonas xianhensis]TDX30752.1 hypothetical protein DFO67_1047 [Halomonas xianhensis]